LVATTKAGDRKRKRVGVVVFQYVENASLEGLPEQNEAVVREDLTGTRAQVVGPYFMGPLGSSTKEQRTEIPSDADEGVIDVLNYRGPKK